MNDFKLKLMLSILGGIFFSFVFIILAFALPVESKKQTYKKIPKGMLEKVSKSARE